MVASSGYAALSAGTLVAGKYRLIKPLGEGAMGVVWSAINGATNGQVALKLILRSEPELRQRLLREAQACGTIRHRNVVQVHDVGQTATGDPFLVMELLHGETLADLLARKRRLGPQEAASVGRDVARALAAAHGRGIVHRDLKPANIFLHNEEGGDAPVVKVLDFGVSKNFLQSDGLRTVAGGAVGSPMYMSPEQARTERELDGQADVWSLGVVLYEMLTGERPFTGETPEVIAQITEGEIPRVSRRIRRIDPDFDEIVAGCLTRDRAARLGPSSEVARRLERHAAPDARAPLPSPMEVGPSELAAQDQPISASAAFSPGVGPTGLQAASSPGFARVTTPGVGPAAAWQPGSPGVGSTALRPSSSGHGTTALGSSSSDHGAAALRPSSSGHGAAALRPSSSDHGATALSSSVDDDDAATCRIEPSMLAPRPALRRPATADLAHVGTPGPQAHGPGTGTIPMLDGPPQASAWTAAAETGPKGTVRLTPSAAHELHASTRAVAEAHTETQAPAQAQAQATSFTAYTEAVPALPRPPEAAPLTPPSAKRSTLVAVGLVVLGATAAAVGVALLWQRSAAQPAAAPGSASSAAEAKAPSAMPTSAPAPSAEAAPEPPVSAPEAEPAPLPAATSSGTAAPAPLASAGPSTSPAKSTAAPTQRPPVRPPPVKTAAPAPSCSSKFAALCKPATSGAGAPVPDPWAQKPKKPVKGASPGGL